MSASTQLGSPVACLWPGPNNYPGIAYPNSLYMSPNDAANAYNAALPHPNYNRPRRLYGPRQA